MKLLVGTLMASVSQLGGIMGLASFFFSIFEVLGISLLNGKTHFRCYLTEKPNPDGSWEYDPDDKRICSNIDDGRACKKGTYCGSKYEFYYETNNKYNWSKSYLGRDTEIYELNYNLINFDNILKAFLTIFQCITMEGWTKVMNMY